MALPVFFQRDRKLYANVPVDTQLSFPELVRAARDAAPKGYAVDYTALKEAHLYGRSRDFPVGSSEPTFAANERAKVRFSSDFIHAYLTLYPPKQGGRRLEEREVREILAAYGVEDELLDLRNLQSSFMRGDYHEPNLVASGAHPVQSEPHTVSWDVPPSDAKGFLAAVAGRTDFPMMMLRVVRPAQVVGKRVKPIPGRPGYTVRGEPLEPRPALDPFIFGEGLRLAPNGAMIISDARGHLRITGDHGIRSEIVPVLELEGSAGVAQVAKPYFFPGSLIVHGDLETSGQLKVLGDMEVRGSLIGAGVEVCGSLFVRDGIINNSRLGVVAGGVVSAGFFERARVWAQAVHIRRYSLHSKLLAATSITGAPSCTLNGGEAESGGKVEVSILGSANSSPTLVSIGLRPAQTLREIFRSWSSALEKGVEPDSAFANFFADEREKLNALNRLLGARFKLDEGFVKAQTVHQGVRIVMGTGSREPGERLNNVKFSIERIGDKERVAMTKLGRSG